jgi:NlpC/P60 family putative phage cell wall peptidase
MSARHAEIARSWLGTPYLHQASCRGAGADCLGLVRGVWREVYGSEPVALPAYSPDWSEVRRQEELWTAARRHLVERRDGGLRTGDVVLFRMKAGAVAKHLGIVGAPDPEPSLIHAYSGHGVVENALSAPWRRRIVAIFAFPEGDGPWQL